MNKDKPLSLSHDWLIWLGEHRDGFLVGGAMIYGLGYLVWSYIAWKNQLGLLPVFEFQYLISGIVPAVLILVTWVISVFFSKYRDKVIEFFDKNDNFRNLCLGLIVVLYFTFLSASSAAPRWWLNPEICKQILKYIGPIFYTAVYLNFFTIDKYKKDLSMIRFRNFFIIVNQHLISLILFWFALVSYIGIYPYLPNEFGGPKPRFAYVDFARETVAPSTLSVLSSSNSVIGTAGLESKVIRSKKLLVYFSNSDYMLVRIAIESKANNGVASENEPLYELRKEIIHDMEWCSN